MSTYTAPTRFAAPERRDRKRSVDAKMATIARRQARAVKVAARKMAAGR